MHEQPRQHSGDTIARPAAAVEAGPPIADIPVVVTDVATVADGIIAITMSGAKPGPLPAWEPGAHIDVCLDNGLIRQYSLCGGHVGSGADSYTIAVLRASRGRGGSESIHRDVRRGSTLQIRPPRNLFALEEAKSYTLIAGGIGITPLLAMVRELARRDADWRLFYGGRTRDSMAFLDELESYGERVAVYPEDRCGLLPLEQIMGGPVPGRLVYCCGPAPLIDAATTIAGRWPTNPLRFERFSPIVVERSIDTAFEVELHRSGQVFEVPADQSILEVLEARGLSVPTSCREGTCGTCEVPLLAGAADHRDSILDEDERRANDTIFVCCSRSRSPRLVLDI